MLLITLEVNEVGHDKRLVRNVHIRCTGKEINFHYKSKKKIHVGEAIEILTDYGGDYEEVRERRGYGYRNLHSGLSSDSSLAARIERSFFARSETETKILEQKGISKLRDQLEFISGTIDGISTRYDQSETFNDTSPFPWSGL